jgi:response regulator RpfG family c-di-GMP phosphodiesterase
MVDITHHELVPNGSGDGRRRRHDPSQERDAAPRRDPWKLLIVDDERAVHDTARAALRDFTYEDRPVRVLDAYTSAEALDILGHHPDLALILLDVVMERDDSGVRLAHHIRHRLQNADVRIIMHSGKDQLGPGPDFVAACDISDFRQRMDLSLDRMTGIVSQALRSYRDIRTIDRSEQALQRIAETCARLAVYAGQPHFFAKVVDSLTEIIGLEDPQAPPRASAFVVMRGSRGFHLLAGNGVFSDAAGVLAGDLIPPEVMPVLNEACVRQESLLGKQSFTGHFRTRGGREYLLYLQGETAFSPLDAHLIRIFAAHAAFAFENVSLAQEMEHARRGVARTLVEAIKVRSKEAAGHVIRVGELAVLLGRRAGLDRESVALLGQACPVHDLGLIGIPDTILQKPGPLTAREREILKSHTIIGRELLRQGDGRLLEAAAVIAHQHHEHWDGSGYPQGLEGEQIHVFARIAAIVDALDALTHDRPHRPALPLAEAVAVLREGRGTRHDPALVDLLLDDLDACERVRSRYADDPGQAEECA